MLSEERTIQILQYVDQVFRQQLDHADKKAATIIAIAAAVLTFNRSLFGIDQPGFVTRLFSLDGAMMLVCLVALALSIAFSFLTITPRVRGSVRSLLFWRTWMSDTESGSLVDRSRDPAFVRDEFVRDIRLVSEIVEKKMRWLRFASLLLFGAMALFILILLRRTFT